MINSVREPSLIMPNFCPRASTSPGRRSHTIRRAMAPEICRTIIRRCGGDSSSRPIHVFSFRIALSGFRALRNSPGEYRKRDHSRRAGGTIQVYVENRQENADPHGRAADELVVLAAG